MTPIVPEVVDMAVDGEPPADNTVCMSNQADEANAYAGDRGGNGASEDEEAEREASESEASETGGQDGNQAFSSDTGWRNAGEATPQGSEGEEEQSEDGWDDGERPDYARDGYDGDLGSAGWEIIPQADRKPPAGAAKAQPPAQEATANGSAAVASIMNGLTTSVSVEAELQCTLCHEVLCKPVTTPCGHSFCRVCLVEFLLSREVSETQCPICRTLVLPKSIHEGEVEAPIFSVNVTLWNVIQLLVPAMREREAKEEDDDYAHKYDQFDAKWRMAALRQAADRDQGGPQRRRRHAHEGDNEIDDSGEEDDEIPFEDDDMDDHSSDEEDGLPARQVEMYPELRRENTVDGRLRILRNVVQDRDDVNVDGYHSMRVGLAVMEFPSVFQLYNEHQECTIAVLKLEEDEDLDGGFPFFTSDDGDDDALIMSDYYNPIRLRVIDVAGNVVMERTRAANQGIVTFPALRLDVPGGTYHFQFLDDLYEICLIVTTELREPGDEDDDSLGDEDNDRRRGGFVLDQAGERNRDRRGRHHRQSDDEDEDEDGDYDSEDSFIAAEDEDVGDHGAHEETFSGSEHGSEGVWVDGDEDEEVAMERLERRRQRRQQRDIDELQVDDDNDHDNHDDHDGEGEEDREEDGEEEFSQEQAFDGQNRRQSQSDAELEEIFAAARSRSFRKRARIVDDDSDGDDESQEVSVDESVDGGAARGRVDQEPPTSNERAGGTKRSRAIYESDDDGDEDEESKDSYERESAPRGFTSNKRLRQVTSRIFHDDDDEEDEANGYDDAAASGALKVDGGEDDTEATRSRWIGSDPYEVGQPDLHDAAGDRGGASEDDDSDHVTHNEGHVQSRDVYFDDRDDDLDQGHSDASEGSGAEHWDEGDVVEDDEVGEEVFSD